MTFHERQEAKKHGWKPYVFRFRKRNGAVKTVTVYASDDETAAILFDRTYSKDCEEVIR